jgi:hypothetical protein
VVFRSGSSTSSTIESIATQRFFKEDVIMTTQQSTRIHYNNTPPHDGILRGAITCPLSPGVSSFQRYFFKNRPFDPLIAPWWLV